LERRTNDTFPIKQQLLVFCTTSPAIQVCKETDAKSMRLRKNNPSGAYSSSCSAVRHTLRQRMKSTWKDTMRYRISGDPFPKYKAVVFDLSKADELLPSHSGKKKTSKFKTISFIFYYQPTF